MDTAEARRILAERLGCRALSYSRLVAKIGHVECEEIGKPGKKFWQMESQVVWDHKPNGDIRVLASIDDEGWRAFAPLMDGFIKASNDEFVCE